MEEIKKKRIDELRLENLRKDAKYLRQNGYNIISVSETSMRIDMTGILFDYHEIHALYITCSIFKSDEGDRVLFLEY